MFRPTCLGLSIVLLCCVQTALADSVTNKCTDGKQITYTDKPCEKLGLKDAGAINKDAVTIVPAVTYRQVPQNFPREQAPRNPVQEDNDVYQCTTSNGLVSYSSTPCPKASLLPQGFYAPIQQEVIRQSAACEKINANHDASINSNLTCP